MWDADVARCRGGAAWDGVLRPDAAERTVVPMSWSNPRRVLDRGKGTRRPGLEFLGYSSGRGNHGGTGGNDYAQN